MAKFLDLASELITEHQCTCVWDLGDTTDDRSAIPMPTISTISEGIGRFPDSPYNIALIGNHQQYLRDGRHDGGGLLSSKFTVVRKIESYDIDAVRLIVCPYVENLGQLLVEVDAEITRARNDRKPIVLLGHFEVVGAKMNSGTSTKGIPRELLERANVSLLGHIHSPHTLGQTVHYVGTPFQQNFGEAGENKRVAVVSIYEDGTVNTKFVPITGFPEYHTWTWNEFQNRVNPASEDRIKVLIRTADEARAYYSHPLAPRAIPVYMGAAQTMAGQVAASKISVQDPTTAMQMYLKKTAIPERLNLSQDDLLSFGAEIVGA